MNFYHRSFEAASRRIQGTSCSSRSTSNDENVKVLLTKTFQLLRPGRKRSLWPLVDVHFGTLDVFLHSLEHKLRVVNTVVSLSGQSNSTPCNEYGSITRPQCLDDVTTSGLNDFVTAANMYIKV